MTDVAVFEDNNSFNELLNLYIENPHTIVARAVTSQEGRELAKRIVAGEVKVDVVILDGTLENGSEDDGQIIANMLGRMENPPIVVGISAGNNIYAKPEYRMRKQEFLGSKLVALLNDIEEGKTTGEA
jgi:DNA-binding response OmpR family regulator